MLRIAAGSSPVSRSVPRSASTIEPRQGCEVSPDIESIAASMASTPASTAASTLAADDAGGVVGVEVDRQADLLAERRDQLPRRRRLEQPGHVLDAEDVGARRLELLGEADVVFQVVLRAARIEDVAGVADGALAELAGVAHRVHRDAHVLDPVEAVEDAEEVDAGRRPPRCTKNFTTLSG